MILKTIAILSLLALPLSVLLWHASHRSPVHRRYDVTLYKSLRVYLKDGVCGLRLLSMPTKTASRSEFHAPLNADAMPNQRSLQLSSRRQGPYRITWLVFPLWLSTSILALIGAVPLLRGPIRQRIRRWRGQCIVCGYDLTGNRSGRCPECGQRFRR
ncbi:MAG: hypothetical protein IIC01_01275 [Planctomycetes bacterium]|nr:hypothetical protein [Planctomycetota bacterium]